MKPTTRVYLKSAPLYVMFGLLFVVMVFGGAAALDQRYRFAFVAVVVLLSVVSFFSVLEGFDLLVKRRAQKVSGREQGGLGGVRALGAVSGAFIAPVIAGSVSAYGFLAVLMAAILGLGVWGDRYRVRMIGSEQRV